MAYVPAGQAAVAALRFVSSGAGSHAAAVEISVAADARLRLLESYESNDVVISGGVDEGARIVALGVQKLDPAQKVRVVSSLSF